MAHDISNIDRHVRKLAKAANILARKLGALQVLKYALPLAAELQLNSEVVEDAKAIMAHADYVAKLIESETADWNSPNPLPPTPTRPTEHLGLY